MKILITQNSLVVKTRELGLKEREIFDALIFPEYLDISKDSNCCVVKAEGNRLYNFLYDLSEHFDIELE